MSYISYNDLYDYQKDIVNKMDTSKCIWLPPSTGKTLTSIWAYKLYGKGKLLIISPANMVNEWEETLEEMEISNYDIYSYNKLCYDKYMKDIIQTSYDTCIIDEHQHLNNYKNKSTRQLLKKIDDIRLRYLLSATPSGNYEWKDLYVAFRIMVGKCYKSYSQYRNMYFIEIPSRWNRYVYDIVGYKNTNELIALKNKYAVIYTKEHKAKKLEQEIFISAFDETFNKTKYSKIIREKVSEDYLLDSTAKTSYYKRMVASGMKLIDDEDSYKYNIINDNKLKKLKDLLTKHSKDNIVIFYNYKNEYSLLSKYFEDNNIGFTHFENKNDLINKKPTTINLISYSVGSEGVNNFKDCVVYIAFSLPYSYIKWKQSKGRINRLDNYPIEYYYYLYNEIDYKVLETIKKGKSFSETLMSTATLKN